MSLLGFTYPFATKSAADLDAFWHQYRRLPVFADSRQEYGGTEQRKTRITRLTATAGKPINPIKTDEKRFLLLKKERPLISFIRLIGFPGSCS
jgi:hypothetical protein